MTSQPGWDAVYVADQPPPWDIGRPQPVFTRLADQGLLAAGSSTRAAEPGRTR